MPQLRSGRHFGLNPHPLLDALEEGSEAKQMEAAIWFGMEFTSPRRMADYLDVIYFEEGKGAPPNAPMFSSGHLVVDVLEGKAGWTADEIQELSGLLEGDPRIVSFLDQIHEELMGKVRIHLELWDDRPH
jgi:hypothetical protein